VLLGSTLMATLGVPEPRAGASAPAVSTVPGTSGVLNVPSGIAFDAAGDLFVADTDHCRVLVVPDHAGSLYGRHVRAGHPYDLAGTRCAGPASLGYPTGVAVDGRGNVYIAEAADQRVLVVRPGGTRAPHSPAAVAGTGVAGYNGSGLAATSSLLSEPTGVAVDPAGDVFIADTANCRVRELPVASGPQFGQAMTAGDLYNVAGTGTCGSAGRNGPAGLAQLSDPLAVAVDRVGDLLIADNGDQSVLEVAVHGGTFYGTPIGGGDLAVVVGGQGNGPYLEDGLPATSVAPELNDPEGVAVSPDGTLYITDGSMHCIRVVPDANRDVFGQPMTDGHMYTLAGALPVSSSAGSGDGTRWVLTHLAVPVGIAVSPSGAVVTSDRTRNLIQKVA
jgi:sugar lactone lactonase YvrE